MNDYVELYVRSVRGWPWPDRSNGLAPMYGEDGWCESCGTPLKPQCGPLTLLPKGMRRVKGVWVPNWRFDSVCLDADLAEEVAARFAVELRPIAWRGKAPIEASQIVPTVGASDWFEAAELAEAAVRCHGKSGATCPVCGQWRWLPIPDDDLPPLRPSVLAEHHDVIASLEWFGAGCRSFHELLFCRPLAEHLAAASPRTVELREVRVAGEPEPVPRRRPTPLPRPASVGATSAAGESHGDAPELLQFADLGPEEFARHPVWVNCHTFDYDEPWYEETDEETFRPWEGALPVDPAQGIMLVRARFTLADGSEFGGFLTPQREPERGETLHPMMFAGEGPGFAFWGGVMGVERAERERLYATLGKSSEQVFPIRVSAEEGMSLGVTRTVIEGFSRMLGTGIEVSR